MSQSVQPFGALLILGVVFGLFWAVSHVIKGFGGISEKDRREMVARKYALADERTRTAILSKTIHVGMTEEQVVDSWGKPVSRRVQVLKTKVKVTLVYGSLRYGSRVHLDNGLVAGWKT